VTEMDRLGRGGEGRARVEKERESGIEISSLDVIRFAHRPSPPDHPRPRHYTYTRTLIV